MRIKKAYLAVIGICLCLNAGTYFLLKQQSRKIAVADAVKLFNGYNMKKELEGKDAGALSFLGARLDSLGTAIKNLESGRPAAAPKQELYTAYRETQAALEEAYAQSNQSINEQVWTRLNPLIEEFGREKGFHLVIGANGMGSVLYKDDYYDVTDELIHFVNNKYEGK